MRALVFALVGVVMLCGAGLSPARADDHVFRLPGFLQGDRDDDRRSWERERREDDRDRQRARRNESERSQNWRRVGRDDWADQIERDRREKRLRRWRFDD